MKTAREVLEARAGASKETNQLRGAMLALRGLPEDYSWAIVLPNGEVIDDRTAIEIAHKAIAAERRPVQTALPLTGAPRIAKSRPPRERLSYLWPEVVPYLKAMGPGDSIDLRDGDFEACRTNKRALMDAQKVCSFRAGVLFGSGNYVTALRGGVLTIKRFK